ncbi:prepilin-type N-terminal cleavage/methylation domain-containing protein [Lentisphaera marina]|uniref:type II secretion system protein n=1 Tax=Lentisphaera marina TaxID=1111041 RepID=UPI00236597BF|nr:prepilin-type N-terminal cleavage/methylation domain-containing protein [Lentisphaera marina]MDD7986609.1 prepilin-type N-terminal cleavage/methylation domain-containing protein [Lentisphaera marina]
MKKFTLIELLVVIAIIGILSSLLLPSLGKARSKSKAAVCLNNLKSINFALLMYSDDNSDYFVAAPSVQDSWDDLLIGYDGQNRTLDNGGGYKTEDYGESIKLYHCPENGYANDNGKINRSYAINAGMDLNVAGWKGVRGVSMLGWWTENGITTGPWSMRLSEVNDPSTAIIMSELNDDYETIVLGYNGQAALGIQGYMNHLKANPTKHVKAYAQNYLFADGHIGFHYAQSLAADSGVDVLTTDDARGTFFDCQD